MQVRSFHSRKLITVHMYYVTADQWLKFCDKNPQQKTWQMAFMFSVQFLLLKILLCHCSINASVRGNFVLSHKKHKCWRENSSCTGVKKIDYKTVRNSMCMSLHQMVTNAYEIGDQAVIHVTFSKLSHNIVLN